MPFRYVIRGLRPIRAWTSDWTSPTDRFTVSVNPKSLGFTLNAAQHLRSSHSGNAGSNGASLTRNGFDPNGTHLILRRWAWSPSMTSSHADCRSWIWSGCAYSGGDSMKAAGSVPSVKYAKKWAWNLMSVFAPRSIHSIGGRPYGDSGCC